MRNLRAPAALIVVLAVCGLVAPPVGAAGSDYLGGTSRDWKRVRTSGLPTTPDHIVVTSGGRFVAIEDLPSGQGALPLTSPDGRRWRSGEGRDFPPNALVSGLVTGSRGLLASGKDGADEQEVVVFWRSRDGRRWTQIATDPEVFGAPGDTVGVNGLIKTPKGYLAVGYKVGDDGALDAATWSSKDGSRWTQAPVAGALDEAVPSESAFVMNEVALARGTYVAVGLARSRNASGSLDEEPAVWTSTNGRRWVRRTNGVTSPAGFSPDSAGARQVRLTIVVPTDGGFAAAGNQEHSQRDYTMGGFALFSKNGKKWSPARTDGRPFAFPPSATREVAVRYAASAGGGAVITGIQRRADAPATAKIWSSKDGKRWKSLKGKLVDGYVEGPVAGNEDGALVLGYPSGTDGSPTLAWIGGKP